MPDFLIRDLDETTMRRLKERAQRNARSLQAEVKETLRSSAKMTKEEFLELSDKWIAETAGRDLPDLTAVIRRARDAWHA